MKYLLYQDSSVKQHHTTETLRVVKENYLSRKSQKGISPYEGFFCFSPRISFVWREREIESKSLTLVWPGSSVPRKISGYCLEHQSLSRRKLLISTLSTMQQICGALESYVMSCKYAVVDVVVTLAHPNDIISTFVRHSGKSGVE